MSGLSDSATEWAARPAPAHGDGLRALGAHEVVDRPSALGDRVHGVLDTVGGPTLVEAYDRLALDLGPVV